MKFDAIVGNPPYQVMAAGDANGSDPIYHLFIDAARTFGQRVSFVHSARFLFNAGKTPKEWNEKMLNDEHYKVVKYWVNSFDAFPTVDIKGGVAVTYWDKNKTFGKIGTFVAFDELNSILKKVKEKDFKPFSDLVYPENKFNLPNLFSDYPECKKNIGSEGKDKRFRSNAFEKIIAFSETKQSEDDIEVR